MTEHIERLTDRDLSTVAGVLGLDSESLRSELTQHPWRVHEVLSDPDVFDVVMDRRDHPAAVVSPFLMFSVLIHRVAAELRDASYVNDWSGPSSRLPVFDVEPLQEFVGAPGRLFFLSRVLAHFAAPSPPPVPADPLDLGDLAGWLDAALPHQRSVLLRMLGDLSLFMAGVYPDRTGRDAIEPRKIVRLGESVGMSPDEIAGLFDAGDPAPGLSAMESLGSRWYAAAADTATSQPVLRDVAHRFRAARRVLNHLTDGYLYRLDLRPDAA